MSSLQSPEPVKLIIGMFMAHGEAFQRLAASLAGAYGPPDMVSPWIPFDQTDYYFEEMGGPLQRRVLAFTEPMDPGRLPMVKRFCHELEQASMVGGRRRVNIDPGYLCRSRFVLATGKDFTHRIYIGDAVYADLTLVVKEGALAPLPWTYPDYQAPALMSFLERARKKHLADLARGRSSARRDAEE